MDGRAAVGPAEGVRRPEDAQVGSWPRADESNKYTMSIPLGKAMDDILVAYAQNGEPVRPHQGYPLRLVVPGWEAIRSVKWLTRIDVVDQPYMAWHETRQQRGYGPERQGAVVPVRARSEVGHHATVRRSASARPRILRDHRSGVDRRRRRAQGRGIDRRRTDLQGRGTSAAGASVRAHAVPVSVDVERRRGGAAVALHDERGEVQPTLAEAAKNLGRRPPSTSTKPITSTAFSRGR